MSTLNERIKEQRISSGKTLLEVADMLGVKEATMQRYESGAIKNIKHETIAALADIFGCTPAFLMGWENNPWGQNTVERKAEILTEEEHRLLSAYRMADVNARIYALEILEAHVADENASIRAAIAASDQDGEDGKRRTR